MCVRDQSAGGSHAKNTTKGPEAHERTWREQRFFSLSDMVILGGGPGAESNLDLPGFLTQNSAYLSQVLTVFQTNLAQDVFHCFTCLSDLLDVSNGELIHYSSESLSIRKQSP